VKESKCDRGSNPFIRQTVEKAISGFESGMDDDFNTAAALASIHDLVREINTHISDEMLLENDRAAVLDAISLFDSVFGIFGKEDDQILDSEIESLISERQEARRSRDFARSDAIRDQLAEKGIILEDTKDGVRWKRG
jgi:cysteinyl-tRNA synthetase